MPISITPVPTSPRATVDFTRVTVAGADQNTLTGYSGTEVSTMPGTPVQYPASPEVRCYLTFELDSVERGRSYVFAVSDLGDHEFNNYLFPEAGSWTIHLRNAADDTSLANQAVTVQ